MTAWAERRRRPVSVPEGKIERRRASMAVAADLGTALGELRADTRTQLERDKAMRQVIQARDLALDALLDQTDIPLPESVVADEVQHNRESIEGQLSRAGASRDGRSLMCPPSEATSIHCLPVSFLEVSLISRKILVRYSSPTLITSAGMLAKSGLRSRLML